MALAAILGTRPGGRIQQEANGELPKATRAWPFREATAHAG
ncbi:MAG: hypothetical protein ACRDTE_19990 [Pseudonocardiaceae bacterium]